MKKKFLNSIPLILIILSVIVLLIFEVCKFSFTADGHLNALLNATIPRLITGGALVAVAVLIGIKSIFLPDFRKLPKHLLWCVPCVLVILANFPFSALINGSAKIVRTDLIALFILECFSIGLMEEVLFRGLVQDTLLQVFRTKPYGKLLTVIVTSALFALIHLLNLFAGAGVGATFLQVGYCFLIGAMFSAVLIKTDNIWLCVLLHAAFDIGGNVVTELGTGYFQDLCFWILTAVTGVICFVHILYYLLKKSSK